jgi:hypothetical protein
MPGNVVALRRIDPLLVTALKTVPLANTPLTGTHSFYTVIGKFTPGSTFIMDSANNVDLLVFAAFGSVPFPTADVPVSVTLYIDGQIVDAATGTYKRP